MPTLKMPTMKEGWPLILKCDYAFSTDLKDGDFLLFIVNIILCILFNKMNLMNGMFCSLVCYLGWGQFLGF